MVGWHHRVTGREFEQSPGDGEGQAILVCFSPRSLKESDTIERLKDTYFLDGLNLLWQFWYFSSCWTFLGSQRCRGEGTKGSSVLCLQVFMPPYSMGGTVTGLVCLTKESGRRDAMSFPGQDHKAHSGFCLSISFSLSLWSFPLRDTSYCLGRTLRQPFESSYGELLRPPAYSHMNGLPGNRSSGLTWALNDFRPCWQLLCNLMTDPELEPSVESLPDA